MRFFSSKTRIMRKKTWKAIAIVFQNFSRKAISKGRAAQNSKWNCFKERKEKAKVNIKTISLVSKIDDLRPKNFISKQETKKKSNIQEKASSNTRKKQYRDRRLEGVYKKKSGDYLEKIKKLRKKSNFKRKNSRV